MRRTGYWMAAGLLFAALGALMGRLMALHAPESDRVPLVLLLGGPPVLAALQWLGDGRPLHAFVRTVFLTTALVVPLVLAAGSRAAVLSPGIVAAYLVACGLLAVMGLGGRAVVCRLRKRTALRDVRLTRDARFAWRSLGSGLLLVVVAGLFTWHAHALRPDFDPIEYPTPFSRAMDWWTWGYLALLGVVAAVNVATALRVRRYG